MKQYSIPPISKTRPTHLHAVTGVTTPYVLTKTALVWLLIRILAWKPKIAMLLGKLIWGFFPWLKEA